MATQLEEISIKNPFLSRGFVGGILTVVFILMQIFDVHVSAGDQIILTDQILMILTALSGLLSSYGRLKADKKISF